MGIITRVCILNVQTMVDPAQAQVMILVPPLMLMEAPTVAGTEEKVGVVVYQLVV